MEQLLSLRSIPISLEFKVQNARYEMRSERPTVDVQRTKGSFRVSSKPTRVLLDAYDSRASIGLKTVADSVREYGDLGMQAAYDATGNFAEEGNQLMDIQYGSQAFGNIAFERMQTNLDSMLGFSPEVPVNIDWEPADFSMQYEMDKMYFDWRVNTKPEMEYIPGKLEYTVKEYPRLEIMYMGRPVYVPPSADPEYEPQPFDVLV